MLFIYQCAHTPWHLMWTQHNSSLPVRTFLGCPTLLGSGVALGKFQVDGLACKAVCECKTV